MAALKIEIVVAADPTENVHSRVVAECVEVWEVGSMLDRAIADLLRLDEMRNFITDRFTGWNDEGELNSQLATLTEAADLIVGSCARRRSDLIPPPVSREAVLKLVLEIADYAYANAHADVDFPDEDATPFTDRIMALIEGRKP